MRMSDHFTLPLQSVDIRKFTDKKQAMYFAGDAYSKPVCHAVNLHDELVAALKQCEKVVFMCIHGDVSEHVSGDDPKTLDWLLEAESAASAVLAKVEEKP